MTVEKMLWLFFAINTAALIFLEAKTKGIREEVWLHFDSIEEYREWEARKKRKEELKCKREKNCDGE